MALPTTGDTWANVLEPTVNPLNVRKGVITDIIIADYRRADGSVVRLDVPEAGLAEQPDGSFVFTPFAGDGQIRTDLLFGSVDEDEQPSYLQGHHIGFLKDDGWTATPDTTVDETPVAQSIWSVRQDVTKGSYELMFVARESTVLTTYLDMDLPLVNGLPDQGTKNLSIPAPLGNNLIERIIIAIGVDGDELFARVLPRVSRKKPGKQAANKKDPFDHEYTYAAVIDPYTKTPYIASFGGFAWTQDAGSPILGTVVPTPVTGLKVNLVFDISGEDITDPTFTATKTTGGSTTPLTLLGSPSIVDGVVTLVGTTLVATTVYTGLITCTGSNGLTATAAIPSFTAIA